MKKIFKYIILLIFMLITNKLLSQNSLTVLQKLQIKDNHSGFLFFSAIPKDFNSELSSDKTKILITIINASLNNTKREVHSSGLLQDIFSKQVGDTIKITVIAKSKTGYTLLPLPYSKTLMIELFDWDKLNKAQDNYRRGLLALEDGIINPAEKSLAIASDLGNPNAAANLGLLQLYDGKLKSAFKNLLFANKLHSNIPDAYSGLSQIYKMFGMKEKSNIFADKFTKMTGLKSFPEIIIGEIPVDDSLDNETIKLLEKINQPNTKEKKVKNDSLNKKFKDILKPNENKIKENTTWQVIKSFFPDWFFNYILIVIALVFLALAVLWYSYIKWKKIQLEKDDKTIIIDRNDFEEELDVAKNTNAIQSHASQLYKENELKSKGEQKPKTENKNEKIEKSIKTQPNKTKKGLEKQKEKKDFDSKIDMIAQQLIAAQKEQTLEDYEENLAKESEKKKNSLDANTKLVRKLQSKKQKIKQEQLQKLSEDLPEDSDKINELAKKMKLEKRGLEIKKNLKKLEKDDKSLDNIKKKFIDKNKDNP